MFVTTLPHFPIQTQATPPIQEYISKKDSLANFKKQFWKLVQKDKTVATKWENYKTTRTCRSMRPCVRIQLNFCIVQGGDEFLKLEREFESGSGNRRSARRCTCALEMEELPMGVIVPIGKPSNIVLRSGFHEKEEGVNYQE